MKDMSRTKTQETKKSSSTSSKPSSTQSKSTSSTTTTTTVASKPQQAPAMIAAPVAVVPIGPPKPMQIIERKENNFKWMRFLAEFIGCFSITFIVVATNTQFPLTTASNHLGYVEIVLAQTFVYATFYAAFRHISGGHCNPAVTLTYMVLFEITTLVGILYILFQLAGAILGGLLAWGVFTSDTPGPVIDPASFCGGNTDCDFLPGQGRAFLVELIGASAVCFVFPLIDLSRVAGSSGYVAIGFVYGAFFFALKALTNAYFNPAVALGAAVAAARYDWNDNNFWIFIIAPIVSAVWSAAVYGLAFQLPGDGTGPHLQFFSKQRKPIKLVID